MADQPTNVSDFQAALLASSNQWQVPTAPAQGAGAPAVATTSDLQAALLASSAQWSVAAAAGVPAAVASPRGVTVSDAPVIWSPAFATATATATSAPTSNAPSRTSTPSPIVPTSTGIPTSGLDPARVPALIRLIGLRRLKDAMQAAGVVPPPWFDAVVRSFTDAA